MSALSLALAHFTRTCPLCAPSATPAQVLELLERGPSDVVIAVAEGPRPVGLVRRQRLQAVTWSSAASSPRAVAASFSEARTADAVTALDFIEPLAILPAHLPLADLGQHLQTGELTLESACAVVDAEGSVLGLLDWGQVLQTLLVGVPAASAEPPPTPIQELAALRLLLNQLPLPIALQTLAGETLWPNHAWQEQLTELPISGPGASPQSWCHCEELPARTPDRPELAEPSRSASQLPDRVWQFAQLPLTLRTERPVPQPEALLLVLATDVTEQRQLCKELSAKNADLVQLNRLKDEFLACISHELKTPLTAVMGLSSLLKDRKLGDLNHRQQRYAQLIYQSGRQLMNVVNDILDLTRLETGQMRLNLETVNVRGVCERVYQQAQLKISGRDSTMPGDLPAIRFSLEIEAGLETIVADELRLRQMLVHLLENALKFTPPGGEVGMRVSRWQGWIDFTVWDTGIGIPESAQHLIFQKFQQLESPLTRQYEGTGLGLVLTQRLARAHGGDISFISKVGEGSQFTLLLPPAPPERERLQFTSESLNQLVLIVEAVPPYIERLTRQLHKLGYRVAIARSGTEALEKARQVQPRVILLNPLLPQLSGWDVLTLLKADPRTQNIPIVVTATRAERQQALRNGATGFLSLPVKAEELQASLGKLREHAPRRRDLTLLQLAPNTQTPDHHSSIFVAELGRALNAKAAGLNCRILEAGDLEQASILARVWRPDVLLLDGGRLSDPAAYLEAVVQHSSLASLPLVTLDAPTTAAANQFSQLAVYPCLVPIDEVGVEALLQAIQVAAGLAVQHNILLVSSTLESATDAPPAPGRTDELLQALVQYLQTAGLRSLLATSWSEVYHQIQQHNVDLLVVDLGKQRPSGEWLASLQQLQGLEFRPPVLVLVHPQAAPEAEPEIARAVTVIANRIIHCPPQSMAELLTEMNQLLEQAGNRSQLAPYRPQ